MPVPASPPAFEQLYPLNFRDHEVTKARQLHQVKTTRPYAAPWPWWPFGTSSCWGKGRKQPRTLRLGPVFIHSHKRPEMKSSPLFAELVGGSAASVSEAAHLSQIQKNEIQRHLEWTLSSPGLYWEHQSTIFKYLGRWSRKKCALVIYGVVCEGCLVDSCS